MKNLALLHCATLPPPHLSAGRGRVEHPTKFLKREAWQVSILREGCWEKGGDFFHEGSFLQFFQKKETKIWNISWQKIFQILVVKKEGLGQFPNLRGWGGGGVGGGCLAKNSRWCFWGRVDTLMDTMHSGTHVSNTQFHIVISHWTCGRNVGEDFLWIQYEIF